MAEQSDVPDLPGRKLRWEILWKYSTFESGDSSWSMIVAVISPVLGAAADDSGCPPAISASLRVRTASVVGDATWSGILTVLGEERFGYDMAIVALALYVLIGAGLIWLVPDVRPSSAKRLTVATGACGGLARYVPAEAAYRLNEGLPRRWA